MGVLAILSPATLDIEIMGSSASEMGHSFLQFRRAQKGVNNEKMDTTKNDGRMFRFSLKNS